MNERRSTWSSFCGKEVWIILSLTPLPLGAELVSPRPAIKEAINSTKLPEHLSYNTQVNAYHTCLNEFGILNEDLRHRQDGQAHRLQVFRNGHIAFLISLQSSVSQITQYALAHKSSYLQPEEKLIRFTDFADALTCEHAATNRLWVEHIRVERMMVTVVMLNTTNTKMYSREGKWDDDTIGGVVRSPRLEYSEQAYKSDDPSAVINRIAIRFVNYYGLHSDQIVDKYGQVIRPEKW